MRLIGGSHSIKKFSFPAGKNPERKTSRQMKVFCEETKLANLPTRSSYRRVSADTMNANIGTGILK